MEYHETLKHSAWKKCNKKNSEKMALNEEEIKSTECVLSAECNVIVEQDETILVVPSSLSAKEGLYVGPQMLAARLVASRLSRGEDFGHKLYNGCSVEATMAEKNTQNESSSTK
ncbi:hypothetical protein HUJ04_011701 [Dendroctonus ponderosae]|nr:hypothetical protein HUJ04_011701 [Dendroctonus ponderosae]